MIDDVVVGEVWPKQVKSFLVPAGDHRVYLASTGVNHSDAEIWIPLGRSHERSNDHFRRPSGFRPDVTTSSTVTTSLAGF